VVRLPSGQALVQTLDFFTPIVNDPYRFGAIAAANALSDVYAMGGQPWTAMNIVCFPVKDMDADILVRMLRGGLDKVLEAGAVPAGGHSVEDPEIKYGLSVTGLVDPDRFAANSGLAPGQSLVLTKPLGTGVLATAVKGGLDPEVHEEEIHRWASRLNAGAARVIREFRVRGATDVTGFGLGGHLLEMARASGVRAQLELDALPLLQGARDLAAMGMLPAGSFANRDFCASLVRRSPGTDELLADLAFDAQTSGGLILGVDAARVADVLRALEREGEQGWVVGRVLEPGGGPLLELV
jgi:selenide,water dikinase